MDKREGAKPDGFSERPSGQKILLKQKLAALDPISEFLLDSLVTGTRLHQRNGISYLTLRRWRSGVKQYQIGALRAQKYNPPPLFINAIADEIVAALEVSVGPRACNFVVPIPCSRSAAETCLSILIAEKVAAKLRLPAIRALSIEPAAGASHPITNASRAPMRLIEPIGGSALLLDDVATSGAHIEEGTRLLRPTAGTVFSIAWIGGTESSE